MGGKTAVGRPLHITRELAHAYSCVSVSVSVSASIDVSVERWAPPELTFNMLGGYNWKAKPLAGDKKAKKRAKVSIGAFESRAKGMLFERVT